MIHLLSSTHVQPAIQLAIRLVPIVHVRRLQIHRLRIIHRILGHRLIQQPPFSIHCLRMTHCLRIIHCLKIIHLSDRTEKQRCRLRNIRLRSIRCLRSIRLDLILNRFPNLPHRECLI
jgi:hypothetical protein